MANKMYLDIGNYNSTYLMNEYPEWNGVDYNWGYPLRALWVTEETPFFI